VFCVESSGVAKRALEPSQLEALDTRHFLTWIRSAAEEQRAEAAFTLAWAYRYVDDSQDLHRDLELCVAELLDDPSPAVRLSLARGIAGVPNAPRHIVIALADDRPEIAATVLAQSPVLSELEIVQHALAGEECVQMAIARRPDLSPRAAACLAEKAGPAVLAAMAINIATALPGAVLHRIAERFGKDRLILAALLARSDLPAPVRYDLIETAATLCAVAQVRSGLDAAPVERLIRMAVERRVISMASAHRAEDIRDLIRHLRVKGRLTTALLLRALASGETGFFEIAAADLANVDEARAAALVRDPRGSGFAALIRRAGFPSYCVALFRLALLLLEENGGARRGQVLRPLVSSLIDACAAKSGPENGAVVAILHRLEKEAALDEARVLARNAVPEGSGPAADEPVRERLETPRKVALLDRLNAFDQGPAPLAMAS
jgi:uncharacterized protein (DUF2336 family)